MLTFYIKRVIVTEACIFLLKAPPFYSQRHQALERLIYQRSHTLDPKPIIPTKGFFHNTIL